MKKYLLLLSFIILLPVIAPAQTEEDMAAEEEKIEKIRTESGVDPTRVSSRFGYSVTFFDRPDSKSQVSNRVSLYLGIRRWLFTIRGELASINNNTESGFTTGLGDTKFSVQNTFFVKNKFAMVLAADIIAPTGKAGFGSQYFSISPSIVFSYSIDPSMFLAIQPQYSFAPARNKVYPRMNALSARVFVAKFTKTGWYFLLEPRPAYDFTGKRFEMIISPLIGKSLGGGFNLIAMAELPVTKATADTRGFSYLLGFNMNF